MGRHPKPFTKTEVSGLARHVRFTLRCRYRQPALHVRLVPWHKVAAIGIGGSLTAPPLPHHRTYGSVYGGSRSYANALRSNDSTRVGWAVRGHSPPRAIRCLPVSPAGLHPSAPMRSPVSTGYSAACRSRDSCPTCLSSRLGLQPSFPVRPICCLRLSATECLTSLVDDMT